MHNISIIGLLHFKALVSLTKLLSHQLINAAHLQWQISAACTKILKIKYSLNIPALTNQHERTEIEQKPFLFSFFLLPAPLVCLTIRRQTEEPYLEWICSCWRASSGNQTETWGLQRTWLPQREGKGCEIWNVHWSAHPGKESNTEQVIGIN